MRKLAILPALLLALSAGRGFAKATAWVDAKTAEAKGWSVADLATTLQLGDINGDGRADLCGYGS